MESLTSIMHTQIDTGISSAINDIVISQVQNIFVSLPLKGRDMGTGTSTCHQGIGDDPDDSYTSLPKKDSRSAFDIREDADLSPYIEQDISVEHDGFGENI